VLTDVAVETGGGADFGPVDRLYPDLDRDKIRLERYYPNKREAVQPLSLASRRSGGTLEAAYYREAAIFPADGRNMTGPKTYAYCPSLECCTAGCLQTPGCRAVSFRVRNVFILDYPGECKFYSQADDQLTIGTPSYDFRPMTKQVVIMEPCAKVTAKQSNDCE
jgi:hypothetical protein